MYIDSNVKRLPNGNVIFWQKQQAVASYIEQIEVDCVAKEYRAIAQKVIDGKDNYGNTIPTKRNASDMSKINVWGRIPPTSIADTMASLACRVGKPTTDQTEKLVTKKKVTKKKSRKKQ